MKPRHLPALVSFAAFVVLTMSGCVREPALFLPAPVADGSCRIATDWQAFLRKETPTGMTVALFSHGGSTPIPDATETTNDITGANFTMQPQRYAAYVFNQSATEFSSLAFSHLDDWQSAEARAATRSSRWYSPARVRAADGDAGYDTAAISREPLVTNVEWLGTAAHDSIPVTQQMLDSARGTRITVDTLHARNVVYTVTVYVHIKNIGSLRSARASMQGLAAAYLLGLHHTSAEKATQLLEQWSLTIDSTATDGHTQYGTIVAQIPCLGLPYGHHGSPPENLLHLECLLKNDSVLTFNYEVGDRFEWTPDDNVDLHFTIDITMKDPLPFIPGADDKPSAFEVTVEDWGDEGGIPLPI